MTSSFLVSKLSAEGTKKRIYKLISEKNYNNINIGETIETTEEINKYAACFYRELYSNEENDEHEQSNFINSLERKVNLNENEMIIKDIERSEVKTVLDSVETGKSPGIDGIPYEFYQTFWNLIKRDILRVIQVMKTTLTLSDTQNLAVIALHPKEGDIEKLSNWRPISLMCCDYKILSKIIAN